MKLPNRTIIATLEAQLAETAKKRDATDGPRRLKAPEFYTHQANVTMLTQETGRRKRRLEGIQL